MKRTISDKDREAVTANGHAAESDDRQEVYDRARSRSIKWDEANLEENDKIKAELKPVKISEPKTPYHGPMDMDALPDEDTTDMAPLTLEEAPSANGRSLSRSPRSGGEGPAGDEGHATARRSVSQETSASNWSNWSTEDSEGESSAHKRRRFELLRKEHYNMRQALRKGKQLAEKDLKEVGGTGDGGEQGDTGDSGDAHRRP